MLKILINAYACSPNMGSEPGMAWNWCVNLAKSCELHIITEGEFRNKIEAVMPTLPQGKNMHFYYNPVSPTIRAMCWNQGDWRFYKHYRLWQFSTYQIAQKLTNHHKFDILHQLNMIGFREPGYLWKISDIPFVWGPVDAKDKFPVAYLREADLKTKFIGRLKNFITTLQLRYSKRVRHAVEKAAMVIAASSNSQQSFQKFFKITAPLINETGCYNKYHPLTDKTTKETLDLLWVGKLDFRKQLGLAIHSIAKTSNKKIKLHIIGAGETLSYKQLASTLNVSDQCIWYGSISHHEVQQIMQKSDLLFFTSVAEGTPHVVLEAISNNLPVLCFDTCGQGDTVNNMVGIKISLSNPKKSIAEFSSLLNYIFSNKEIITKLSQNCTQRQHELSWSVKVEKMIQLYQTAINN